LEARVHDHPDANAYAALGIWFGENRKSGCAAQAFQAGLNVEPNSPRLTYLLGLSLYTAGNLNESVAPLRRTVELQSKEERPHLLLASALVGLGRYKEAFAEWQAALRIDPGSKMALDGIANILLGAGDNETVIAQLSSTPLDENLTVDLAIAHGRAGQLDDAARVLNQGLKTYPDATKLSSSLVSIYVKQVRLQEAEEVAQGLSRRYPRDIEAQRVYLQVLVLKAENEAAAPLARKLLAQVPHDADFLYLNGVLERTNGDLVIARKHLEEAATLDPNRYSTRFNLGCTLEQLQDNIGAKEQLLKAIEINPNEAESHFELAKVLRKLSETDAAQQQLVLYQKQLKDQSDQTIAAQKSAQAAEAAQAGDMQKAAARYRDAIAVLPDNAGLYYRLALILKNDNNFVDERNALEQAVKIDPTFALAQYELGFLNSRDGDKSGAERRLRQAIDASPGYAQAWVALAGVLAEESRIPDALQAVESALKIAPNDTEAIELRKNLIAGQAKH